MNRRTFLSRSIAAIFGGVIGVFAPKPVLPKPDLPRRELEWDSVYREHNGPQPFGIIEGGEHHGKIAWKRADGKLVIRNWDINPDLRVSLEWKEL